MKTKKTLAILLALILSASVALVSCNEGGDDNIDENDDFVVDFEGDNGSLGGDEDIGDSSNSQNSSNTNNSGSNSSNTSSTEMTATSDTVYVLYTAKIREQASDKSSVEVLATAPFGASLARTGYNSKWSKVTYTKDGVAITGYIANDLITTNAKAVNFIEQKNEDGTPVITKIKSTINANNAIIRIFPLADGYPNTFKILDSDDFSASSIVAQIPKGTGDITVVSVSEDKVWAYVKGLGNLYNAGNPSSEKTVVEGYTLYSNLEISGNSSSSENSGAIG